VLSTSFYSSLRTLCANLQPHTLCSLPLDSETNNMSGKEACTHYHTSVIALRSPNGYKARCLSCGADSPEREKAATTFVALLAQSYRERLKSLTR
jgi:hypothetical protein